MNRDFKSQVELETYVEYKVLPNVELFARKLVEMGDVFNPDPVGLYHPVTGECIVNFDRPGYYIDVKTRKRVTVGTYDDFDRVNGDLYDYNNRCLLPFRDVKRIILIDERPVFVKAREAATCMVGEVLSENFGYSGVARDIERPTDVMDMESIEASSRRKNIYHGVRWEIARELDEKLDEREWHEMWLYKQYGVAIIEVQLDIRIKQYYLQLFREQARDIEDDTIQAVSQIQRPPRRSRRA